jgi:hypothetical protein
MPPEPPSCAPGASGSTGAAEIDEDTGIGSVPLMAGEYGDRQSARLSAHLSVAAGTGATADRRSSASNHRAVRAGGHEVSAGRLPA